LTWFVVHCRSVDDDRGSITAEFVTVMPAVLVILACCLGGLRLAGEQLRLQDTAGLAARAAARGDPMPETGAHLARTDNAGLVCVTASASEGLGLIGSIDLKATGCALG
jgi:hypothetical protein